MESGQVKSAANSASNRKSLSGMFADRISADNAYSVLTERGYTYNEISLIMSAETHKKHFPDNEHVTESGAGIALGEAAVGSAIGGTIGAIVGVVAALSTSLVVPGLGLIIAGPIIAGIAGAGAGVVTGGIIGALSGAGISASHAQVYEAGINKGFIVLAVDPRNAEDADYFEQKWREDKGFDIHR